MYKRRLVWTIAILLVSGLVLGQAERSVVNFMISEGDGWRLPLRNNAKERLELILVVLDHIGLARIDVRWNGERVAALGAEAGSPLTFSFRDPGSGSLWKYRN